MVIMNGEKCYTFDEAAAILEIGVAAIRKRIAKGYMTPVLIAGKKHLNETQLKEYDQQRRGGKKNVK